MSLLELFKSHMHNVSHSWHHNELASFYSGYYGRAVGLDRHHLHHEFRECMGYSDEALFYWGEAIKHFNRKGWPEFKQDEAKAIELSQPLFEECLKNNKYNIALAELDQWFSDFWSQEDAVGIMVENIKRHPVKVTIDVILMRLAWAIGYYHGAGVAYGRLWTRLMGHPKWNANPNTILFYAPEPEVEEVDTADVDLNSQV